MRKEQPAESAHKGPVGEIYITRPGWQGIYIYMHAPCFAYMRTTGVCAAPLNGLAVIAHDTNATTQSKVSRQAESCDVPSVSLALPPVGRHSTCEQLAHSTTVCAWLKTVEIMTHPGHFTSCCSEGESAARGGRAHRHGPSATLPPKVRRTPGRVQTAPQVERTCQGNVYTDVHGVSSRTRKPTTTRAPRTAAQTLATHQLLCRGKT